MLRTKNGTPTAILEERGEAEHRIVLVIGQQRDDDRNRRPGGCERDLERQQHDGQEREMSQACRRTPSVPVAR